MQKTTIFLVLFIAFSFYSFWVYTDGTNTASTTMSEKAIHGKVLYQKYNCTACHQIYGLGGYLGAELTDILSKPGRNPEFLKAMIQSGARQMPQYGLTDEECDDLIAFIQYVNDCSPNYKKSR